ncbi:DUF460 domain-containing protein [Pyrobaculum neutrophilum]|uniref:Nuclease RuvC n=1 Tax=Pyrobaculum neutrophilum (strain DSM 2338 / JCM 9278 / NBRC 100436 / V24Sta) TaxID=444157 RepID=B1YC37_PYRNV|nr:DUF460 domain-containing protein [Pyrobaculum neutrophilum]ACB40891.1 Protein of unknown function DUF460 [Pyrobaculum neutrophilum V24Sta]
MAVVGIDIAPGGQLAYAVLENSAVVERGAADPRTLAPLFKKYRVDILAVDSISELFQHGRKLVKLLGRLPYVVKVVEVTRGPEGYRKTEELVREHLGVFRTRLEPVETAEYLAKLASMGVGTPVKLFEEETIVMVYRRISTAQGGMSRNRYMRNVSHRIKSIAAKIEGRLKEAKLDYDLFIREESGEVTSAKFVVYANREVVRRYVKPMRSIDVAVAVYSAPAKRGEVATRGRFLILGVDPGIYTGLAILTLDGEVLDTVARRGLSRGDLLRYVNQWGVPALVATDVAEPPEFVKKLAAMSGAALYAPHRDMTSEEKSHILDKVKWRTKTTHERDALAAAYKAYLEYRNKFEKLEREFGAILKFEQLEYAKALIIRGYSIAQAVSEALKKRESEETRVVYVAVEKPCPEKDAGLLTKLKAMEYENQQLQKELEELRRQYSQLRRWVEDEKWRDAKYREMQNRIETLVKELSAREAELERLKTQFLEILQNYGSRYKLLHTSEVVQCRGGEPAGTICGNIHSIEEAVARRTMGVPLPQVAKLKLGEYYVIDVEAVRRVTSEIRERLDKGQVDLRKIIEQYRRGLA